jgi:putative transposase
MQRLLSGYATWSARRHRRAGSMFHGRFRDQLLKDQSTFWTTGRYVHLNPVHAGLVEDKRGWICSSHTRYAAKHCRGDWIA